METITMVLKISTVMEKEALEVRGAVVPETEKEFN
jgi:hypothetical protein